MKDTKVFDHLHCCLEGKHLVEASAGTGKTYALTRIFLRLVLEGYRLSEILVVTFTVAASKELAERIYLVLQQAFAYLHQKKKSLELNSQDLELLANYDKKTAISLLEVALGDLDKLSVSTIHSFCRQVLEELPLTATSLLDAEWIGNEDGLKREVVMDFWQRYVQNAPMEFLQFLVMLGTHPDEWIDFFCQYQIYPQAPYTLPFRWQQESFLSKIQNRAKKDALLFDEKSWKNHETKLVEHAKQCKRNFSQWQENWPALAPQASHYFSAWKERILGKKSKVDAKIFASLDEHFTNSDFSLLSVEGEYALEALYEQEAQAPPLDCTVAETCEPSTALRGDNFALQWARYRQDYERFILSSSEHLLLLFQALLGQYSQELLGKKERQHLFSYNELITKLHSALGDSADNALLLSKLHRKYRIALIDEFQDTDVFQSEIFQKIFTTSAKGKTKGLFFIGDPKQSIYSFRGSDIYAYQKLKQKISSKYSLGENYRSTKKLLQAINAIYESHQSSPFLEDWLTYNSVHACDKNQKPRLQQTNKISAGEEASTPLRFVVPKSCNEKWTVDKKLKRVGQQVSQEIKRILQLSSEKRLSYEGRKVVASDIAILVRQKQHGYVIREALAELGIPVALRVEESIFASAEARDLLSILYAISENFDIPNTKAALSTLLWGYGAEDIYKIFTDKSKQIEVSLRFREYYDIWQTKGFVAMFYKWLYREKIAQGLVKQVNGERSLSNLLHLAEVIQNSTKNDIATTLCFLEESIEKENHDIDESTQMRLTGDGDAVQIMTIHASKGLEFPIVFCPTLWHSSFKKKLDTHAFCYYDRVKGIRVMVPKFLLGLLKLSQVWKQKWTACVEGGLDGQELKKKAQREIFAEELRLVYVAMTRAKERLYIYWEPERHNSPAFYLFSGGTYDWSLGDRVGDRECLPALCESIKNLANKHPQSIGLFWDDWDKALEIKKQHLDLENKAECRLVCRSLARDISSPRAIHSFSSLKGHYDEWMDAAPSPVPEFLADPPRKDSSKAVEKTIFHFPYGIKAGNFFHTLLENLQGYGFKEVLGQRALFSQIVNEALVEYDFDLSWEPCITEQMYKLMHVPLVPEQHLSLGSLSKGECISELAFFFRLDKDGLAVREKTQSHQTLDTQVPHPLVERHSLTKFGDKKNLLAFFALSLPQRQGPKALASSEPRKYDQTFFRGYIDLVFEYQGRFYLLDWKSNFLGVNLEDYDQDRLIQDVSQASYHLQYYMYTDALDRFLSIRLPHYEYAKHFGGVFYIYLRGISQSGRTGIYMDCPSLPDLTVFRSLYKHELVSVPH